MRTKLVQGLIVLVVAVVGAFAVIKNADGWADWVVFGVIVLTAYGFAIAVAPRIFTRRKRTISRSGGG